MKIWIPKNRSQLNQHLHDPLFKNAYFLMGNTLLSAGAGFFFWIFAARFYSPEDVGLGSALISAMGLLCMLSLLGFDIGMIRYLPNESDKAGMINSCFTITAVAALLLSVVFLCGLHIWSPALMILRERTVFGAAFVMFTVAGSLAALQVNVFVAFRQAKYSFVQAVVTALRIVGLPLLIALGAFGIYAAAGFASVIAFVIGNLLILKVYSSYRPGFLIRKGAVNDMMHYSFGNYIANIFTGLPGAILPLLVVNVLGAKMNAYFYIAWAIAFMLSAIPLAVSRSLLAEGSHSPDRLRRDVIRSLKFIFVLLIPAIIFVVVFGRYVLMLFGTEYAENSFDVLVVLCVASLPYAVNAVYTAVKRVQGEVGAVIWVYGVVAVVTIVGCYLLMGAYGVMGVGYAWVLGNGAVAGGVLVKMVLNRAL